MLKVTFTFAGGAFLLAVGGLVMKLIGIEVTWTRLGLLFAVGSALAGARIQLYK